MGCRLVGKLSSMVTTWEGRAALFAHSCESQDTCEKEDIAQNTRQEKKRHIKRQQGTSLVVQWLRICLPMQGTCYRATKPTCCSWRTEKLTCSRACVPQLEKACAWHGTARHSTAKIEKMREKENEYSLVAQWLGLSALTARSLG